MCRYCFLWDPYPSQFCSPPKHIARKRPLHIKERSLLINTSPYASLGDVGFHGLQDPFLGLDILADAIVDKKNELWDYWSYFPNFFFVIIYIKNFTHWWPRGLTSTSCEVEESLLNISSILHCKHLQCVWMRV